jgi:hypothetical protein
MWKLRLGYTYAFNLLLDFNSSFLFQTLELQMITKGIWQELKERKNFCLLRHRGRLQFKQFLETQLPKASPRDSSSNRGQGEEEDIHSTQRNAQLDVSWHCRSVKTVSRASHLLLCKRCVAANAVRLGSLGGRYQFVIGISHWEPLTLVQFIFRKSLLPKHKTLNV